MQQSKWIHNQQNGLSNIWNIRRDYLYNYNILFFVFFKKSTPYPTESFIFKYRTSKLNKYPLPLSHMFACCLPPPPLLLRSFPFSMKFPPSRFWSITWLDSVGSKVNNFDRPMIRLQNKKNSQNLFANIFSNKFLSF